MERFTNLLVLAVPACLVLVLLVVVGLRLLSVAQALGSV